MKFDKETIPVGPRVPDQPPADGQAQLVCFEGCRQTIDLMTAEVKIGRQSDNDLVLSADRVSRYHARVLRIDRDYFLEDLGSVNGTLLNGRRVEARHDHPLRHKDVLQVCDYRILYLDWRGFAQKLGLATIRLDSEAVRKEADEILKGFLDAAG